MRQLLQGLELCRYNYFVEFQCICADYGFAKESAELCLARLFYVPPVYRTRRGYFCYAAFALLSSFEACALAVQRFQFGAIA